MLCDDCPAWHDMSNESNGTDGCCSYGDDYVDNHSYEFKKGWGCYRREKTIERDMRICDYMDSIYAEEAIQILSKQKYWKRLNEESRKNHIYILVNEMKNFENSQEVYTPEDFLKKLVENKMIYLGED